MKILKFVISNIFYMETHKFFVHVECNSLNGYRSVKFLKEGL